MFYLAQTLHPSETRILGLPGARFRAASVQKQLAETTLVMMSEK